jgi:hypothetical protein
MSTVQGGQGNIVTNGLVLNLDAANPRSYPQPYNGTTWTDLSGNTNNGTLINGPTYNSSNGGSIVLDGVDDYVNCGNNNSINVTGSGLTLNSWVYRTSLNSNVNNYRRIIEKAAAYPALQYSFVTTPTGSSSGEGRLLLDLYLNGSLPTFVSGSTQLQLNTWYNAVATYDGSFRRIYLNGVLDGQLATTGNITSTVSNLVLGEYLPGPGTTYAWNGRIAQTQIYNRALNASEVLQNFNATRARFGV